MYTALFNLLNSIDHNITVVLNYDGGTIQDYIWLAFSSRLIWVIPAIALLAYLYHIKTPLKKIVLVVIAIAIVVTLCDQTTSTLMKPYFARLRPSHTPGVENMLHYVNGYRGGQYGFASSHAANSIGVVTFVAPLLRKWKATVALLVLAICVCYSRIYLGVHFFGDVLVGGLIGAVFGYAVYLLFTVDWNKLFANGKQTA